MDEPGPPEIPTAHARTAGFAARVETHGDRYELVAELGENWRPVLLWVGHLVPLAFVGVAAISRRREHTSSARLSQLIIWCCG